MNTDNSHVSHSVPASFAGKRMQVHRIDSLTATLQRPDGTTEEVPLSELMGPLEIERLVHDLTANYNHSAAKDAQ